MKKTIALLLSAVLLCMSAACSPKSSSGTETAASETLASETSGTEKVKEQSDKEQPDDVLKSYGFKGVVSLTKDGEVIYQYVNGKDSGGNALTVDSAMYIGSVSKQFCAASIIMLRDKGKLSVDDTLDKYFPEYEAAKKLTVRNLLTMRSGILDMVNEGPVEGVSYENTEDKNTAVIKEWIFSQPLKFEPDSAYAYSNSNYFLLADIVKQISGKSYHDFVRENIFKPLGMSHSGFVEEVTDDPAWAEGLARGEGNTSVEPPGLANGAGDVASNAADMDAWMAGLSDGTVVSKESFREMTENYSTDSGASYGYGLMGMAYDGTGHPGAIGTYGALDYINPERGLRLFIASNKASSQSYIDSLPSALLKSFIEENNP